MRTVSETTAARAFREGRWEAVTDRFGGYDGRRFQEVRDCRSGRRFTVEFSS